MRRLLFISSLVSILLVAPTVVAASDPPNNRSGNRAPISECISTQKKLDVLFVVDQSISLQRTRDDNGKKLPGTDPNDERVTALKAVLNVLQTKANQSEEDSSVRVTVAHSGFGSGFQLHQDWTELNDGGFEKVLARIDSQANLDNEKFTRYHKALEGVVKTFESRSEEDDACRMVIWFSDGRHDDDDVRGGFTNREKNQISKQICGTNGLADKLRSNGIFVVAAGLSADERELELMRLVSEDTGLIPSLNLSSCGSLPPFGKFEVAKNSESLVETLFNLVNTNPGGNNISPTNGQPCADGTPNCSEISFKVTDQVKSFTMLVDRGAPSVQVKLTTGPGQPHVLFETDGIVDANVTAERISGNKLYLDVQRKKNGTIDGIWTIRFTGKGNESARALVKFLGAGVIQIYSQSADGKSSPLVSIDRFETNAIGVDAKTSTTGVAVADVEIVLRAESTESQRLETPLLAQPQVDGSFLVSSDFLKDVVRQDAWKRATQAEVVVRIRGEIAGLIDSNTQKNVPVEFNEAVKKVLLTNGTKWPTFLGQPGEIPQFVGTDKQKVFFRFKGADGRDTVVKFEDNLDTDLGLVFIKGQECKIPDSKEIVCELELKPSRESYGEKDLVASAEFEFESSDSPNDSENVDLPLKISMKKATNVSNGVRAAVILLFVFLVVQAIQRFFFAWLMTRYSPLTSTSRKVRLDVSLDTSGHVTIKNKTDISGIDESFTFDNVEPSTEFDAFSYSFRCSPFRTFLHSTTSPKGLVLNSGRHVIGSSGLVISKKMDLSTGLVDLSLRNQWVLGIENSEAHSLIDGSLSVPAEMIVFLEPYEMHSRDDQLSELEFTIASGNLGQSMTNLLETLMSKRASEPDEPVVEHDIFSSESITQSNDPWGTSNSFEAEPVSKNKKQKRRKSKDGQVDEGFSPPESSPFTDDPFA